MLIKEYRICMPMTVEEYRIAQLYMIQKKSREESTGKESGVEILKNEPYANGPGGNGQYTFKVYHVGSHLPSWLRSIIPETALRVEEEAWNAYPYTRTRYRVPFVDKFTLEIETKYLDDGGDTENVFEMSSAELDSRIVDFIDIVTDPLAVSKESEDPTTFVSQVTGRGPLTADWREQFKQAMMTGERYAKQGTQPDQTGSMTTEPLPKRIMCSYKVCKVEFKYWGMQTKIEKFIHDMALRRTMVSAHRQAWTWQDEWYGLTMTEIRRLEAEAAAALAAKMHEAEGGTPQLPSVTAASIETSTATVGQAETTSVTPIPSEPPSEVEQLADSKTLPVQLQNGEPVSTADDVPQAPPLNFGSSVSFHSESERAAGDGTNAETRLLEAAPANRTSVFMSTRGSDVEDTDNEDFFDAQSVHAMSEVSRTIRVTNEEGI